MTAAFTRVKSDRIPADAIRAPGLKPASFISHGISGAWEFDDAALANEETISGAIILADDMDKTVAPTFIICWSSTTTSKDCYWQLEYLYLSDDESTTAATQETKLLAATSSAVAEGHTHAEFILQIPAALDSCIQYRIKRRSASAEDTIADTVELHSISLDYTADIIGAS